jgi:hypothetical protein
MFLRSKDTRNGKTKHGSRYVFVEVDNCTRVAVKPHYSLGRCFLTIPFYFQQKSDYELSSKDRRQTVEIFSRFFEAGGNMLYLPDETEYCLRGLECRFYERRKKEKRSRNKKAVRAVTQEEDRQFMYGRKDPESTSMCLKYVSAKAREQAYQAGAGDAAAIGDAPFPIDDIFPCSSYNLLRYNTFYRESVTMPPKSGLRKKHGRRFSCDTSSSLQQKGY